MDTFEHKERASNPKNPHKQMIRVDLLTRILRQAGITREEWIEKGMQKNIKS